MAERRNIDVGERFGCLLVLDCIYKKGVGYLLVECDCGRIEIKRKWPILSGKVKECLKCTREISGLKRKKGYKDIDGTIMGRLNRNAKVRGILVKVDPEYLYNLFLKQGERCAISNLPISIKKENKKHQCTASLDRIDSSKEYSNDNVQWVHKDINLMKQNLKQEYFIEICKQIAKNN